MDKRYLVILYPLVPVPQHDLLDVPWETAQSEARRLSTDGMVVLIMAADTVDGDVLGDVVAVAFDQELFFPQGAEGGRA